MRKLGYRASSVLLILVLASSALAIPRQKDGPRERVIGRLVRVVRAVFGVSTTSDGLRPPLPAPCTNCP